MGTYYEYLINGPGQFIVIKRWKDKEGKEKRTDYYVTYKKKRWQCDPKCKGFWYSKDKVKKVCKHIKFLSSQLKLPDLGILREASTFEWEGGG